MLTRLRRLRADRDAGFTLAETLVASSLAGVVGLIGVGLFIIVGQQTNDTMASEQNTSGARVALNQVTSTIQLADSPLAVPVTGEGRIVTFNPTEFTFYANRDSSSRSGSLSRTPPSKITIKTVGLKLMMFVYRPKASYGTSGNPYPSPYSYPDNYPTTPDQSMILTNGIANNPANKIADESVFTYCSSAPGAALPTSTPTSTPTPTATASATTPPPPPTCDPIVPTGGAAKDAQLALQISSVVVRLKVGGADYSATRTGYQPTTWLVSRAAITGKIAPVPTASAPSTSASTP